MNYFWEKINIWAAAWGFIYGLVALGFYFTPIMIFLLGLASASTAVALQNILFQEYRGLFLLLGALLVALTVLFYLREQGAKKLTLAEISPHRFFIGTVIFVFILTYFSLVGLITFGLV